MEKFLFRGVNKTLDESNDGKLLPRDINSSFKSYSYWGQTEYNDGSVYGESEINAVIRHQKDSSKYPTSGISTTPKIANAIGYATHSNQSGYVYKIDTSLLEKYFVSYYIVEDHAVQPTKPDDKEIILVAKDNGALPAEIVTEKIEVQFDQCQNS